MLVRQADHAVLSGQLAALWGQAPWSEVAPRDSVLLGARLHDLAWVAFDERLPRRADGRPYAFFEVSRAIATGLYSRGIAAVEAIDGYAGLLTSLHFTGFYVSHFGWPPFASVESLPDEEREAVAAFLATEHSRQRRLRDRLGLGPGEELGLGTAFRWLQLWDRVSLDVCRRDFDGWEGEYPPAPVSAAPGAPLETLRIHLDPGGRCRLEPYPLRFRPWAVRVPAVFVPAGSALEAAWQGSGSDALEVTFW